MGLTFETALLFHEHTFFFVETVTREQTQHAHAFDGKLAAFQRSSYHFDAVGRVGHSMPHDNSRRAVVVLHNTHVPGPKIRDKEKTGRS